VNTRSRWWGAVAAAGLVAILAATLYPEPGAKEVASRTSLFCLVCGEHGGTDVILNLLLFIPFATGLRLWGWSWGRVTLACAALSFTVESCQYFLVPGRDASLSDLLTNTTGGSVAAAVAPLLRVALAPDSGDARRLLLLGVVTWIGISAAAGWLFLPWVRHGRALSERCDFTELASAYTGKIRSVTVSGDTMPDGRLDHRESARVSDLFAGESIEVRVEVLSQEPSPYRRWIYRLRIGPGQLVLSQQGTSLVFEVPRQLAKIEIFNPSLRLDDGAPDRSGVPFTVVAGEHRGHLWVESTVEGHTRRATLALAPTMVWGLVVPYNYAFGPEAWLLTLLWVGGLMVPLGFWARRTGQPVVSLTLVGAAVVVGLGLVPWLSQTGPVPLRDWLAAIAGVAAGWAARAPAAYLATRCGSPSANAFSSS
jgi:VanZ family protein